MKELLSDPTKWTQGESARDEHGNKCSALEPQAVCFCLLGAMNRCYPGQTFTEAYNKLAKNVPNGDIADWNDDVMRTHPQVLALITELDI